MTFLAVASVICLADEEWTDVVYFERHDAKMRIHVYDPPIVLEWGQLPEDTPEEARAKLEAVVNGAFYHHDTFESWYARRLKFSTSAALEASGTKEDLKKQFLSTPSFEEIKKEYPRIKYTQIIYCIDYLINGEFYSYVVEAEGKYNQSEYPNALADLSDMTGKVTAGFLKLDNGTWKNHVGSLSLFELMREFSNPPVLKAVMEAGYCYHSIAEAGLVAFDPPELLKVDSVRDRYAGETMFHYPAADERAATLRKEGMSSPARMEPETVLEPINAAPETAVTEESNRSKWVWVLGVYALVMTVFAVRVRGRGV